jgi:hypothetical protein
MHTAISLAGTSSGHWHVAVLLPYSSALNLLDYSTWGILQAKGNAIPHAKIGSLKQTI